MRTLAVSSFLTLDGVMQAPGGPEEDPTGGFEHGGWSVSYWDDTTGEAMAAATAVPFDLLLGRKTYEIFAAHWPHAGDDAMARALNRATKYVASSTLRSVGWANSRLLDGDVVAAVKRLKASDGPELQVYGSSGLMQTLLAADLIDEFRLMIFPLVVGKGKRLFGDGAMPAGLKLIDHKTSTTGVAIDTYRRAGAVRTGSFALQQPSDAEVERRRGMKEKTASLEIRVGSLGQRDAGEPVLHGLDRKLRRGSKWHSDR